MYMERETENRVFPAINFAYSGCCVSSSTNLCERMGPAYRQQHQQQETKAAGEKEQREKKISAERRESTPAMWNDLMIYCKLEFE